MSKKYGAKDDVVSPGGKSPGASKFSRRQVLSHVGKAAYVAPVMTVLSLLPSRAAAVPSFPSSGGPSRESQNKRGESRTTSRKRERSG